ncbi:hypothetical protein [Novosphingobium huizhouense]|uniref:hypothetical protein n=1 Tax=Novosphingobium huizhouense TaxID=2866625 RepID=UPI001CD82F68|nr:hypothetical protein [Novosphingobium huizhouense]
MLAVAAGLQLALPLPNDVPPDNGAGRAPDWRLPDIADLPAPSLADRASLFSPTRLVGATPSGDEAGAAVPEGPVGGAFVLGAMRTGGRRTLLLRTPERRIVRMAPGQSWQGWRLLAIDQDAARFRKDGKTITAAFGAKAAAQDGDSDSSESDQ